MASVDQLRSLGLDDNAISRRVRAGTLHPLFNGVYAVGHRAITREAWFLAATLSVGEDSGLGFFSACQHLALWDGRVGAVHVVAPRRFRAQEHLRPHVMDPMPELVVVDGIRTVPAAIAVLQLASVTPSLKAVRRVAREAQFLGLATHDELLEVCRDGRRGARRLRHALRDGSAATANGGEDLALDLIRSCGLDPLVNEPLLGYVVDFLVPECGLVIEFDGRVHDLPVVAFDDRRRQADLEAAGYRVLRLDFHDVTRGRSAARARLRAASVTKLPPGESFVTFAARAR